MEEALAKVAPLEAGEMLDGKYRVVRQMGEGGMGIVYEAHHPLLQKTVAIKVLRPELAKMEERRDRFEAEARATAAIGHPNIVAVTDMGETADGALYFVMDRLNGETLAERLLRLKKLDHPQRRHHRPRCAARASRRRTRCMLVHRDLKPDNIFLARSPGGREIAKILDFGIAKALAGAGKRKTGTQLGFTIGTPMYMAPEQALADVNIDARADLWAMGVIIYEMISGRPPFQSEDTVEVLTRVVAGNRPPLATVCPEAPPALVELVESALSGERAKRPATAGEFAARLQQAVFGTATPPPGMITGGSGRPAGRRPNLAALEQARAGRARSRRRSARRSAARLRPARHPRRPRARPPASDAVEPRRRLRPTSSRSSVGAPAPRKRGSWWPACWCCRWSAAGAVVLVKGKPEVLENPAVLKDPAGLVKGLIASARHSPSPARRPARWCG